MQVCDGTMKLLATKNCPKTSSTFDQNELINEIAQAEMTSRPLKKAKYTWQFEGKNENGLHVSSYQFRGNGSAASTSSCDSDEDIVSEPASNIKTTIDHSHQNFPSSSCNSSPTMTTNNNAGIDPAQIASTSNADKDLDAETDENTSANKSGEINNCDFNASKNNAPMQINYALCRWQSKQLAQGIIDNAINKVLGDLGIPSNQSEAMDPAFREPLSWGSYLNAQNIENEGVVEAIRQQGLQHNRFVQQSSGSQQQDSEKNNVHCQNPEELLRSDFSGPSTSHFSQNVSSGTSDSLDDIPATSYTNSFGKKSDVMPLLSVQSPMLQKPDFFDDVGTIMKPEDLLNTAVSYAISEKGLGVLNVNE